MRYFTEKGHQVHLITVDGYTYGPLNNLTVHVIKPVIPDNIKIISYCVNLTASLFKIRKLIRTIKPDILHAHYLTDYGLIGYLLHFPIFVVTVWGSDILVTPKTSWFHPIMAKFILNSSKLVTGDSNTVRNACLQYCNQPEKIIVIQWGINLSLFPKRIDNHAEQKKITILSSRGFAPIYNIDTIIHSIPFVIKTHTNIKYLLKSQYERNFELEQIAESLDVIKYIDFVYGDIIYKKLIELYYTSDIFISVPSSDSSSISLLEAMASGLPVIVSDIPANHEWITEGWNGFIVPVRNPEKLAQAIIHMIENPDLMRLFGERNAQIIRMRADREKHMAHMEDLYKQLLENK